GVRIALSSAETAIGGMLAAPLIGSLALAIAVCVVVVAVRRHHRETGFETTWRDVKQAFPSDSVLHVREEAAMLSQPGALESDLRVSDLLGDFAEEGSGYVEPRDLLALRAERE